MKNGLLSVDNGTDKVVDADASLVAKEYYTEYAKYVLEYRALPSVYDGLKPVQRRIIYTMSQQPMKLMKTAKAAGLVMAYHPHGDSSIVGAMNEMASPLNPLPIFDTKGNFGSVNAGASAPRYTELYLNKIARFNFCQFLDDAEYEVGEIGEEEPSALPCLIPYALYKGSEGIGIGLSTKVMPLNLIDLIDYYIEYIKTDGKSRPLVKPDFGYVKIENTTQEVKDNVENYKGRLTVSSIVENISNNTYLIKGIYGKSIDAAISKVDKYDKSFTNGDLGFRDASTDSQKYVFESYGKKLSKGQVIENLEWATKNNISFTRTVEEDGNAIYSSLSYMVSQSLKCLNTAIDKYISRSINRQKSQLTVYEVLEECKKKNVFKNITSMTTEILINKIIATTSCQKEIAEEIVKKPISYLTRSHDKEAEVLRNSIKDLENHDRKKYLISLYKEFRKMVLPVYESKSHSVIADYKIKNPCVKLSKGKVLVTEGDGTHFSEWIYLICDDGSVCPRSMLAVEPLRLGEIDLNVDKNIIGISSDDFNFIRVKTDVNSKKYHGEIIIDLSKATWDRRFVNFLDYEKVVSIEGLKELKDNEKWLVKSKRSKTSWVGI